MNGTPDPRPPGDDTPRERRRELLNARDWDSAEGSRLIHPDARSPRDEFSGWLDRLVREARHHPDPVDDDAIAAMLDEKATDLLEQLGGGA